MNLTLCPKCNHYIAIGDYPFCPHGSTKAMIERDEIPGGLTCENYGPNPITFYSHTERRAYMKEHGLQEIDKFCPMPGTDVDPQGIPNPNGYVDAKTLENGAILLTRGSRTEEVDDSHKLIQGSFNITGTERDAIAAQAGDPHRLSRLGRRMRGD